MNYYKFILFLLLVFVSCQKGSDKKTICFIHFDLNYHFVEFKNDKMVHLGSSIRDLQDFKNIFIIVDIFPKKDLRDCLNGNGDCKGLLSRNEIISELNFDIKNLSKIEIDGDAINCDKYYLEQNGQLGNKISLFYGFTLPALSKQISNMNMSLIIDDVPLFKELITIKLNHI